MRIPDVTAYRLDEARRLLDRQGVDYYIKKIVTAGPPGAPNILCVPQNYRVVKQIRSADGVTGLLVAPEVHDENRG